MSDMASSAAERILYELKSRGPQSIGDLGARFDMTAEAARQHLVKLREAGLVDHLDEKMPRGRPRRLWRLTDKGHGRFPDSHGQLTVDLLAAAEAVFGAEGVDRLIARREGEMRESYGAAIADAVDLEDKVARLAALRAREGYMAECRPDEAGGFLLIENHCPVCAAARACQGLCRSELALFQAVLGPGVVVERLDHVLAGARRCVYRVAAV